MKKHLFLFLILFSIFICGCSKKTEKMEIGDEITFGNYHGEIEWIVLDVKDGNAFIVTKFLIDSHRYDDKLSVYRDSKIRAWINDDFYNEAFSDEEKEKILVTEVDNSAESCAENPNPYVTENTFDKIFLLSYKECLDYLPTNELRKAKGTEYAISNGLWINQGIADYGYGIWWIRSPYIGRDYVGYCLYDTGYPIDLNVYYDEYGVRPACWIKIS